jgi:hypothetical protein
MEIEALLSQYPLGVAYPFGGVKYVLQWCTHSTGSHLVLADTEEAIQRIFSKVLEDYDGVELKSYQRVEIVAPPRHLRESFAKWCFEEDIQNFWSHVGSLILESQEETVWEFSEIRELPQGLTLCKEYEDRYQDADKFLEDEDPLHLSCKNCYKGLRPANGTLESLYLELRPLYLEVTNPPVRTVVLSMAREPLEGEQVWAAGADFGPHSSGACLATQPADEYVVRGRALFYYLPLVQVGMEVLENMLKADSQRHEQESEKAHHRREEKRLVARKKAQQELAKLFPARNP